MSNPADFLLAKPLRLPYFKPERFGRAKRLKDICLACCPSRYSFPYEALYSMEAAMQEARRAQRLHDEFEKTVLMIQCKIESYFFGKKK